jgi:hypothetical protein
MKKIFWIIFISSLTINIAYITFLFKQKNHREELISLFEIKKINYSDGFYNLNEKLKNTNNEKPYHLIHIWDTVFAECGDSVPYNLQLDSLFKTNQFKAVDCILMSVMRGETIESFLNTRKINLNNIMILNEMDDFISGVCNKRKEKRKIRSVNLLINEHGDILYYNDKIKNPLDQDTLLLQTLNSLN